MKKSNVGKLALAGVLAAVTFLLGLTPIGIIPIPPANVTLMCLPVIIGTLTTSLGLGMVLPSEAFIIPLYHELRWMGLTNTYLALILPQIALSLPFTTLMIATALQQVPRELVEASVMDGASRRKILWGILVPDIWPTLSTLALLLFIWTWN